MVETGTTRAKLGILVGGGPAPGLNGVIEAATREALRVGIEVYGIRDGFRYLSVGDVSHVAPLTLAHVEAFGARGGSVLGTSRTNPTKDPEKLATVVRTLTETLGLTYLVTIGGDDTAFSAHKTAEAAAGRLQVAHVPKTIDNDLPLPDNAPTFGFETARQVGADLVRNLVEDARTTSRWYLVIAMGRTAGHLALGIGASSGATLVMVPEEFKGVEGVSLDLFADILEGWLVKSKAVGRQSGVAVLAEGLQELIKKELETHPLVEVEHDDAGHMRSAEIPLGLIVRRMMKDRVKAHGIDASFVDSTIGYELRCADPVAFDQEYTRRLGWSAVHYLLRGGKIEPAGALIAIQGGSLHPMPLQTVLDERTGKIQVRPADVLSQQYEAVRDRMVRLNPADLDDPEIARAANVSQAEFRARFARAAAI